LLTDYAQRRFTHRSGIGGDRILRELPPRLRRSARVYENYVNKLSRVCDEALRRHGRGIAEQQFVLKRIADIAIDLFVGSCVLSRADALVAAGDPAADDAQTICELFTTQARRRM